ncbi:hypothetical protein F5148DRAFT_1152592 [Russula earlei]|uniref:Uncharacterized protein n=1 Tax=Russula earlei TaxID=71964 RepID=A0ACC0TWQ1_9AGAM|nr:hypothetical protein F5148DRAFT_1152592 [Russula earlei]
MWRSSEVAWHACGMLNVLSCLMVLPSIGHDVVVVAAAVDAEVVAVARVNAVVREGGGAWGGLHRGGVCCLAAAVARSSPLQVAAADMGGDVCGSEMASGSRGMGGKHEFIGISVGVTAETDGVGATTEGTAVDREGMAVGDVGIGVESMNGKGVTEAVTVMTVGEAGAVTTADEAKTAIVHGAEAMAMTGDTEGMGAGRAETGGCRGSSGHGREGWGMYRHGNEHDWEWDEGEGNWRRGMSRRCGGDGGNIVGGRGEGQKGSGRERQREEQLRQEREGCECNVNRRGGGRLVCKTAGGDMTYPVKNWFQPVIFQFWLRLV